MHLLTDHEKFHKASFRTPPIMNAPSKRQTR